MAAFVDRRGFPAFGAQSRTLCRVDRVQRRREAFTWHPESGMRDAAASSPLPSPPRDSNTRRAPDWLIRDILLTAGRNALKASQPPWPCGAPSGRTLFLLLLHLGSPGSTRLAGLAVHLRGEGVPFDSLPRGFREFMSSVAHRGSSAPAAVLQISGPAQSSQPQFP